MGLGGYEGLARINHARPGAPEFRLKLISEQDLVMGARGLIPGLRP